MSECCRSPASVGRNPPLRARAPPLAPLQSRPSTHAPPPAPLRSCPSTHAAPLMLLLSRPSSRPSLRAPQLALTFELAAPSRWSIGVGHLPMYPRFLRPLSPLGLLASSRYPPPFPHPTGESTLTSRPSRSCRCRATWNA
eukprot:361808-Chlamydomonas_euryale.AAC.30